MSSVAASRRATARAAGSRASHRAGEGRDRRHEAAAAALAAFFVLSVGLTDGGYYGTEYIKVTTLLAAAAALGLVAGFRPRLTRAGVAVLAAMAALMVWTALSSLWASAGAATSLEIRRSALYLVALAATAVVVGFRNRRGFLLGLLAAICVVGATAVGMRTASGAPVDRLYGTLLEEPVGYPNALGALVAIGAVLAVGLAPVSGGRSRVIGATTPFLVFVLGLTGSRGGALALALGLVTLVLLAQPRQRLQIVQGTASGLVIGGAAWAVVEWHELNGVALFALATATLAAGWIAAGRTLPRIRSRSLLIVGAVVLAATVLLVAFRPPTASTSYRSDYWRAALAEASEHPLLGSGAGSFYLTWLEHRNVELTVRDAHSPYVETLSELGPVGLILVLTLVAVPLAAAVRRRGDPLAATAGAAFLVFAVHAGVDWDWEMPVVTFAGLACA